MFFYQKIISRQAAESAEKTSQIFFALPSSAALRDIKRG
jgi:hypothetical protein